MEKEYIYDFKTKEEMLEKLRNYAETSDDDDIKYKELIRKKLLQCPELLYALNNTSLENELFNEDDTLNVDGEWDLYIGENGNIRPFLFIPQAQDKSHNYLCYKTDFNSIPTANGYEKHMKITFIVFVHGQNATDRNTGIPRHDLISSILREYFNWSNIFGGQCHLVSAEEGVTDSEYLTRTLVFETTVPNSISKTLNGRYAYINSEVRR